MHTLNFSEAELQQLNYERYYYPCALVQKRMHTLFLKSLGIYSHQQIGQIVGRHPNTVTRDIKRYLSGGIEGLKTVNYGKNTSELDQYQGTLKSYFDEHPVASVNEARQKIKGLTGIERSPTQIRQFMKRIGLKRLKTGHIPAKADTAKQEVFLQERLIPALQAAEQGEAHVVFMDAAHFVLAPFLCHLWCFVRVFIKAPAGRQRINVLGAVDAITQQVHFLTNDSYINANVIAEFLYRLRLYYFDMKKLYIVLDNARYQHCWMIKNLAQQLNIELLFLPPYSPNLNIIERLWKFVKKKCLYAQYYDSFAKFSDAIIQTMIQTNTNQSYRRELSSLLTLKFQRFENHFFIP